jgi:hypothetical protein
LILDDICCKSKFLYTWEKGYGLIHASFGGFDFLMCIPLISLCFSFHLMQFSGPKSRELVSFAFLL